MKSSQAFGKVAVMMGGRSAEREVSLKSGMAVLKALASAGVDAHAFDTAALSLADLERGQFDRVFIALHGRGGEDGTLQGALEYIEMPYTGSGVLPCALAMNKVRTKQIWQACGLPTAASCNVQRQQLAQVDCAAMLAELGGKVMVKPAQEGSSVGMSIASSSEELAAALALAAEFDQHLLVEAWLCGPEYTVAILDGKALPAIRLQTNREFYDYAAKYQAGDTQYHCPAGLSEDEEQQLRRLAEQAFAAIDGYGWGRIDVMRDAQQQWNLLEANTVPGMTEKSLVPMAAKAQGMTFTDLVLRILAQTLD
ncbi:D-alanine--D-alanine ligase [Idiomarina xiamenensis]|uniref:D-alanine--D-alanine ligase n=1 Tax=Idiomarina xiamenensis 10-D-4 TaxID=740709 RepID=K2KF23_9GAMM|nr:D-alanine--D-alanine ligase [Idiomarina xiamenensis]EKE85332.1 D-alanine--D-alanine ligase [Idiomarina xiamenensis 10-D-4]